MKKNKLLFLALLLSLGVLVGCGGGSGTSTPATSEEVSEVVSETISSEEIFSEEVSEVVSSEETSSELEFIDYAANFKYDETSSRVTEIVTVKNFVDGDTVHFHSKNGKNGVLKARFLGVDTPESTGKVQNWGKTASNFTKDSLKNAAEIMIESDTDKWDLDSTGERHLVWVWFRPEAGADWKLLNLAITQEGLAQGKSASSTSYGEVMTLALNQAILFKLKYYSGETEPGFYTGDIMPVTLREIRENTQEYVGIIVQFEALITRVSAQTAYVEAYDGETDRIYGLPVYMGFNFMCDFIEPGNLVSWVGRVEFYETGGTYQLSDLTYMPTKPSYKKNVKLISEGNDITPNEITYEDIVNYGDSLQGANITMGDLRITNIYTTQNGGDNDGAMTLTCKDASNNTIKVRTSVLYHDDDTMVVESELNGKTITVKSGTIEYYKSENATKGDYQIHVFVYNDLIIS